MRATKHRILLALIISCLLLAIASSSQNHSLLTQAQPVAAQSTTVQVTLAGQPGSACLPPSPVDQPLVTLQASNANSTIAGSVLPVVRNRDATLLLQRLSSTFTLRMQFVFKLRNSDQFLKCLAAISDPSSPDYGHFLNATTLQPYLPTPGQRNSIINFFTSKGFTVREAASPIVLALSAPVKTVQEVLGVSLALYRTGNSTFYSPTIDPVMPSNFATLTEGILGLHNLTQTRTVSHAASLLRPCSGPYCPQGLQAGYELSSLHASGYDGSGQKVAIVIGNDDQNPQAAIDTFSSEFGLPHTTLTIMTPPGDTARPQSGVEGDLDVQSVHSTAPGAQIILVHEDDFISGIDYVASYNIAPIVSNSWIIGESSDFCDTGWVPSDLSALDLRLAIDAARGLTMIFGSGDSGAKPGSTFCTSWPASSQNVLSVGGNDLTLNGCGAYTCSGYGSEHGWSGSGGGFSGFFAEPSWQSSTIGVKSGRAVPDVSMLGGSPGVYTYHSRLGWFGVTGTSLSTPLWAGFLAIVIQMRGNSFFGNVAPRIYQIGSSPAYALEFHDVATGSNGYSAAPGWDAVTGWGSPIANRLASALALPVVSTDRATYAQLEVIQFSGTRFTPGGSVQTCLSINNDGTFHCVGQSNADGQGNVAGTMRVETDIPIGPQKFISRDMSLGTYSNSVQLTITAASTVTVTATSISTASSTSYLYQTATTTITSYTSTSTTTSTIPTVTTVVLVPLTVRSTARSTQILTSILTTTVTSYTSTETTTSTIPTLTTVVLVPSTVISSVQSTQYVTSILATTVTSYTATTTSTSTSLVYTTVTASPGGAGAAASNSLAYLGFLPLFTLAVGHTVNTSNDRRLLIARARIKGRRHGK